MFMKHTQPALVEAMEEKGFRVVQVGLSEFLKAGGSAKCLTLKLSEPVKGD